MLPLVPKLCCIRLNDHEIEADKLLSTVSMSKLRILAISRLDSILVSTHEILPIRNLTLSNCSLDELRQLFKYAPMLRYLNIENIHRNYRSTYNGIYFNNNHAIHLKQLIVSNFIDKFDELIELLKQTPNLKSLTISTDHKIDIIDAYQWEYLITSLLLHLHSFKFKFIYSLEDDILHKFKQFQSNFWLNKHHWYTEYKLEKDAALIYTIPYISHTYVLTPFTNRYCDKLMNNINIFDNVRNLILYQESITLNCSFYFPNVISLTLENQIYFNDVDEHILKMEHINSLKMIVNLSNLKHLTISSACQLESSSVLLYLFKETLQLSSITIEPIDSMSNLRQINEQQKLQIDELLLSTKQINERIEKQDAKIEKRDVKIAQQDSQIKVLKSNIHSLFIAIKSLTNLNKRILIEKFRLYLVNKYSDLFQNQTGVLVTNETKYRDIYQFMS
ncbi:unnamed protein product, partial [Rotaria sordida]